MGISNFLKPVTDTAGRNVDLVDYPYLRIAIDISTWIHKVCMTKSELLGNEQHNSRFGRACLIDDQNNNNSNSNRPNVESYITKCAQEIVQRIEQFQKATQSHVLVVLDGATPPVKNKEVHVRRQKQQQQQAERDKPVDVTANSPNLDKRIMGNKRAGAGEHFPKVVQHTLLLLKSSRIPFLVAPYEADTQLAFLQQQGYVDLVVTEDSDMVAYGLHTPVLFKNAINKENVFTQGVLLRRPDLGSKLFGRPPPKFDLTHITDVELAVFFCASGCDYCPNLRGIGSHMACKQTRGVFEKADDEPIARLLQNLLHVTWEKDMTKEEKDDYKDQFLAALLTFRQGLVYDPVQKKCRSLHETDDPVLLAYEPYKELANSAARREKILGKVFPPTLATAIAEGHVNPKILEPRFDDTPSEALEALQDYLKDLPPRPRRWMGPPVPGATGGQDSNLNANAHHNGRDDESSEDDDEDMPATQSFFEI